MSTITRKAQLGSLVLVALMAAQAVDAQDTPIDLDALRDAVAAHPPEPEDRPMPVPSVDVNDQAEHTGPDASPPGREFPDSVEDLHARLQAELARRASDTLAETCALIRELELQVTSSPTVCGSPFDHGGK